MELHESAARIAWPGLSAFVLTGSDCRTWLQGQLTNDVRFLESRSWIDGCLVKSTGQIMAVLRVWNWKSGLLIVTDGGEVLRDRVDSYVILEDVVLEDVGQVTWTVQGPKASELVANMADLAVLPSPRLGSNGVDVIADPLGLVESHVAVSASWEAVLAASLEQGIPLPGIDIDERAFPAEFPAPFDECHVSHEKGCYMGQEVLTRIFSRGHTNRAWVVMRSPIWLEPGSELTLEGLKVGTVARTVESPKEGFLASGFVKANSSRQGTVFGCAGQSVEVWKS